MQDILFLREFRPDVPLKSRSIAFRKWFQGVPFVTDSGVIVTVNDTEALHEEYARVIIQYDMGTIEI